MPWRDTIIYELHVKGFTQRHPRRAGAPARQVPRPRRTRRRSTTCSALGVTTVELMPVQAFVERAVPGRSAASRNYWGYNPLALVRARPALRVARPGGRVQDHGRARCTTPGIEVVLDVVFNHTAEGNELGPTLQPARLRQRRPTTGCARDNRALLQELHRLRQHGELRRPARCVQLVHRLPALLGRRDARGRLPLRPGRRSLGRDAERLRPRRRRSSPRCAPDPVLAYVKLIAEPWDVGPGGYQLGHFPAGWSRVERPLPRHRARASGAATAGWSARSPSASPARATCSASTRPQARPPASTSSPRTTASRCTTWSPTTTGTTRPTARTTATATRTT
ncbi:MAG: hypothetical protein MZV65_25825 [Chromatiales bacterium]|nr:hypothetical protein [Chromatiales bacterium]